MKILLSFNMFFLKLTIREEVLGTAHFTQLIEEKINVNSLIIFIILFKENSCFLFKTKWKSIFYHYFAEVQKISLQKISAQKKKIHRRKIQRKIKLNDHFVTVKNFNRT
jgi:hypothetical protein